MNGSGGMLQGWTRVYTLEETAVESSFGHFLSALGSSFPLYLLHVFCRSIASATASAVISCSTLPPFVFHALRYGGAGDSTAYAGARTSRGGDEEARGGGSRGRHLFHGGLHVCGALVRRQNGGFKDSVGGALWVYVRR